MNKLKQVKLGLGLIVISSWFGALAAPVAEDSKKRATGINFTQIENVFYNAQLHFSTLYGDKDNSHASVNLLQPFLGDASKMVFVDVRAMLKQSPVREFSVGGGYRWLTDDKDYLFGVYSLYDNKTSYYNNNYHQLTLGGEFKTDKWSLGMNYYLALGTQVNDVSITTSGRAIPNSNFDEFDIELVDTFNREYAMEGYDIEVGYEVPEVPGLTTYVAGFDFYHENTASVSGARLSLEYDVLQHLPKKPSWLGALSVVTTVQNDSLRNTLWFAGVNLTIPFSEVKNTRAYVGLEHKMLAPIRRDVDVITKDAENENVFTWTKDDGKHYTGMFVMSEENLKSVTATGITTPVKDDPKKVNRGKIVGIDVVGVIGDIKIQGNPLNNDEGRPEAATEAAIVLNDGQIITGRNITIEANGRTYTVAVVNSDSDLLFASPDNPTGSLTLVQTDPEGNKQVTSSLIRLHTSDEISPIGNHIEDLILKVDAGDPDVKTPQWVYGEEGGSVESEIAIGQQAAAITNVLGAIGSNMTDPNCEKDCSMYETYSSNFHSFGKLYIKNVDLVGGGIVYLSDTVSGTLRPDTGTYMQPSTVRIEGGDYNVQNPYIGRAFMGFNSDFQLDEAVAAITVNTGKGARVDIIAIDGVTIDIQQSIASAEDEVPMLAAISLQTLSGSVTNNTVSASSDKSLAYSAMGIRVFGDMTGTIGCVSVGTACGNRVEKVSAAHYVAGIAVTDAGQAIFTGSINNNIIGIEGQESLTGGSALGIGVLTSAMGTYKASAYINGNRLVGNITAIQTAADRYSYAAGIYFSGEMSVGSEMNNNVIYSVKSLSTHEEASEDPRAAYGIQALDPFVIMNGAIDNNQFGIDETKTFLQGDNVYGIYLAGVATTGSVSNNKFYGQMQSLKDDGDAIGIFSKFTMAGAINNNAFGTGTNTSSEPVIKGGGKLAAILVGSNICCGSGSINNNKILSPLSGNGDVYGIAVADEVGGQISNNQFGTPGVNNNVFVGVKHVAAINVSSIASDGEVQHNQFFGKIRSTGVAEVGDDRLSTSAGYIASGRVEGMIQNNDFTGSIESLGSSYGISISGPLTSTLSNYNFNPFDDDQEFIIKGIRAVGLSIQSLEPSAQVLANTFSAALLGNAVNANNLRSAAVGIYVDEIKANSPGIINNRFATITSGASRDSEASGISIGTMGDGSRIMSNSFGAIIGGGGQDGYALGIGVGFTLGKEMQEQRLGIGMMGNNSVINGNQFGAIESGAGDDNVAAGISVNNDMNGVISQNIFNGDITSGAGEGSAALGVLARGISITGSMSGAISENIFNGAITSTGTGGYLHAVGIIVADMGTNSTISDNEFTAISAAEALGGAQGDNDFGASAATGILIKDDITGSIETNTFTGAITSAQAKTFSRATGIASNGKLGETGKIFDNEFTAISAGVAVGGVQRANDVGASLATGIFITGDITGSIETNTFTGAITSAQATTSSQATGIASNGKLGETGTIFGNEFTAISAGEAVGGVQGAGDVGDSEATGILIRGDITGSIETNTFTGAITSAQAKTLSQATGIASNGKLGETGTIFGNEFTAISAGEAVGGVQGVGDFGASQATGISITGDITGSIETNRFTGAITSAQAKTISQATGIASNGKLGETGKIFGNEFTAISAGVAVGGVQGAGDVGDSAATGISILGDITGSIETNRFTGAITSAQAKTFSQATGIASNGKLGETGKIFGNEFTAISAGVAVGGVQGDNDVGVSRATGISILGDITGSIETNRFTGAITSAQAKTFSQATGIASSGKLGETGTIVGNEFTAISAGVAVGGAQGDNDVGVSRATGIIILGDITGSIETNRFTGAITSAQAKTFSQATGIASNGKLGETGKIFGNEFTAISAGVAVGGVQGAGDVGDSAATGISIKDDITGSIETNRFTGAITSAQAKTFSQAFGIGSNGKLGETGKIFGNEFTAISAGVAVGGVQRADNFGASAATGISIKDDITGSIETNTFTGAITSAQAKIFSQASGIVSGGKLGETGKIFDNEFTAISAGEAVGGVQGAEDFGDSAATGIIITGDITGSIETNTFTGAITSAQAKTFSQATGIVSNGKLGETGTIFGNEFTAISTGEALGGVQEGGDVGASVATGISIKGDITGSIETNRFTGAITTAQAKTFSQAGGIGSNSKLGETGTIVGNEFTTISAGVAVGGVQEGGDVGASVAIGISIKGVNTGSIETNTFTGAITSAQAPVQSKATGIFAGAANNSKIRENKFDGTILAGASPNSEAKGIYIRYIVGNSELIANEFNEAITANGTTGAKAFGIHTDSVRDTAKINQNHFSIISASRSGVDNPGGAIAIGINGGDMENNAEIGGNIFKGEIKSLDATKSIATGIVAILSDNSKITGNQFNAAISAGVRAAGLFIVYKFNPAKLVHNVTGNKLTLAGDNAVGISLAKGSLGTDIGTLITANTITGTTEANKVVIRTQ